MTPKVIAVSPVKDKILSIRFSNDEIRYFDVAPYITGPWYGELESADYFNQVAPAGRTVVWPNGQDIAPHELYDLSIPQ